MALSPWCHRRLRRRATHAATAGPSDDGAMVIGTRRRKVKAAAWRAIVIGVALVVRIPAAAADDGDLAREKQCLGCHAVDRKRVGPAYQDVAARYAGDAGAEARLAGKIRKGGAGAWGVVPMPMNDVTAAEAERLARRVLRQK